MRNLIFLFVKHGGLVTFLFMEVLCMYLVVNNNQSQKEIYFNSLSSLTDAATDKFDNIAQYVQLSSVADSLARENARLLAEAESAQFIKTISRDTGRTLETTQLYLFQHAKVISNSINLNNNTLIINRGKNQSLSPSMGVINATGQGIVGIIKSITGNHARVLSILHRQTKISASIFRKGYFGSVVWKGSDPRTVNLIDVPKHANVVKGDTIQTSGYSTVFPEGVIIGKVDTFWLPSGSNFYEIQVRLINDLNRVKYVHVVENLMKKELVELQEEAANE